MEEVGIPKTLDASFNPMSSSIIAFNAFARLSSFQAPVFNVVLELQVSPPNWGAVGLQASHQCFRCEPLR